MALLLLLAGVATWTATLLWTTWIMHRPPRMTAGRALARLGRATPADVGIEHFTEEAFGISDAARPGATIELAAWWIPHPAGPAVRRCCVLLHGYGDSRAGMLAWAPLWQRLGFHLLLLDMRAHGDSGGRMSGGGVWERDDLQRLLDALRERHPLSCERMVVFGVSYGGMIAAATAARREDVAALVIDSPVEGWGTATQRYAHLLGLPLSHAHRLRLRMAQRWLGTRFEEVRPALTLREGACPVLAILPRSDVLVAPSESEQIAQAVAARGSSSRVWRVDATHNLAIVARPDEYERQLRTFLGHAWHEGPPIVAAGS
jgi:pimeloyl-ACP methyl ester carboxylesterase